MHQPFVFPVVDVCHACRCVCVYSLNRSSSLTPHPTPRTPQVSGIINPSPEILRAPVSGAPCVIYDVIAWEYVDAGSPGAVDCDEEGVEKGEGFDNEGLEEKTKPTLADGGIVGFRNKIWVKRFEETRTADFYLSDPNYSAATHPDGPKVFVPARGPQGGSDGHLLAMDFHPLRKDSTRRGMLTIYFSGTELVIPHNITELGARHGFVHARSRRRVMRYEERAYCVGDPVALMGVVGKGADPFAKPMPVMTPVSYCAPFSASLAVVLSYTTGHLCSIPCYPIGCRCNCCTQPITNRSSRPIHPPSLFQKNRC